MLGRFGVTAAELSAEVRAAAAADGDAETLVAAALALVAAADADGGADGSAAALVLASAHSVLHSDLWHALPTELSAARRWRLLRLAAALVAVARPADGDGEAPLALPASVRAAVDAAARLLVFAVAASAHDHPALLFALRDWESAPLPAAEDALRRLAQALRAAPAGGASRRDVGARARRWRACSSTTCARASSSSASADCTRRPRRQPAAAAGGDIGGGAEWSVHGAGGRRASRRRRWRSRAT